MRSNEQRAADPCTAETGTAANAELLPPYVPHRPGVIGDFVRHPCTWMLLGFAGGVALTLWLTSERKR